MPTFLLNATFPLSPPRRDGFHMGAAQAPSGQRLEVDSRSLRLDDRPWLPVMGEIHYSRVPPAEWRQELLKMKMGGIDIAATYVFWIHHEELQGEFNVSGQLDLRRFVECCHEVGLPLVVRAGPWCHGEVRNGGLPDWLLQSGARVRTDDPAYLEQVRRLYGEVAGQLRGLLWHQGGPVVGLQIENEYGGPGSHLLTLKRLAREAGLDVPLYTRTGWPELQTPLPHGELLPLFGAYAEGFWDRELTSMPGEYGEGFVFKLARTVSTIGTDALGRQAARDGDDVGDYPYFCCEIGGGMAVSYHRRVNVSPQDVEAVSLVKLGSGNNLQGYYMYHGGTNPTGRLSHLQEAQNTGLTNWNDLPVKGYDFQAPLGEFGQLRPHYHGLRRESLFLRDWGSLLATMPAHLPDIRPDSAHDTGTLRWAARTDGRSGFLFVNNYHRLQPMPAKPSVQFRLQLPGGALNVPAQPVTIPANSSFFWPFGLDLDSARLLYATAQPICRLPDGDNTFFMFAQTSGVPAEFVFEAKGLTVSGTQSKVENSAGRVRIGPVQPGTDVAARLRVGQKTIALLLLNEAQSRACWKGTLAGRERLFLTSSGLQLDGDELRLEAENSDALSVSVLPPVALHGEDDAVSLDQDGAFGRFTVALPTRNEVALRVEQMRDAGSPREINLGRQGVAEAPSDDDFDQAAVWRITMPQNLGASRDLLLRVRYQGDVARVYLDGALLTDNFYNGTPFDIGLRRFSPDILRGELELKILPLRADAPIYLPDEARPDFGTSEAMARVVSVEVVERRVVRLQADG